MYTHVIGQNSSGIYLLRQKNRLFSKYVILEKYHHQLGFAFSRSLLLQKSRVLNAEVNEHGIFLVSVRFNKSQARNELMVSFYDENLNPGKFSQKMIDYSPLANYYDKGDFKLVVNKSREYIAVMHTEMSEQKKRILSVSVFDNSFSPISSKQVELPYDYDRSGFVDMKLSDDLKCFFVIEDVEKKNSRRSNAKSNYSMYVFDAKSEQLSDYDMGDSLHHLHNIKMHVDHIEQEINVSGFYSKEHTGNKFTGIYNAVFAIPQPDHNSATYTDLPFETIAALIGQKNAENSKELDNFTLLKAVATNYKEVILVAERNSISNEEDVLYVNGTPQALARNIYNFDDLLILALDSNREIKWHKIIQKNQSSMNDGGYFGSVVVAVTTKSINILFNDNMRNSGNVVQYRLSPEGRLEDKILLHSDTEYVSIIPGESRQISPNTLLIPTVKNKKFALLKISYLN